MNDTERVISEDLLKKIRFQEKLIENVLTLPEESGLEKEALDAAQFYKKGSELILEHLKTEYNSIINGDY